jgi:hypothetical protein
MTVRSLFSFIILTAFALSSCEKNKGTEDNGVTIDPVVSIPHLSASYQGSNWMSMVIQKPGPQTYTATAADGSQVVFFFNPFYNSPNPQQKDTGYTKFGGYPGAFTIVNYNNDIDTIHVSSISTVAMTSRICFTWKNDDEQRILKYVVQRSYDSTNYIDVLTQGPDNQLPQSSYVFIDNTVNDPAKLHKLSYRLKIFKKNGQTVTTPGYYYNFLLPEKLIMAYLDKNQKMYFSLDDFKNYIHVTSYNSVENARKGSFSFRFINSVGALDSVSNGQFFIKDP